MKKIFAAALAAVMCLSLCACGTPSGNGGNGGNGESGGNGGTGGTQGQEVVLTESTDFQALVSDKVTDKVWDAAFTNDAFAGCTSYLKCEREEVKTKFGYQKADSSYDARYDTQLLLEGNWERIQEMIVHVAGTNATEYSNVPDSETGELTDTYEYITSNIGGEDKDSKVLREWAYTFRNLIAYDFSGQFEKFSYDETLHAYTYEGESLVVPYTPMEAMGEEGYILTSAIVKIVGGKLAYAKVEVSGNQEDPEEYFYFDYGKAKVTIPEEAIPMPEE